MTSWISNMMKGVIVHGKATEQGNLSFDGAPPEVLRAIHDDADAVMACCLEAVDGIGDGICFMASEDNDSIGEVGMGLTLQILSDLMQCTSKVKDATLRQPWWDPEIVVKVAGGGES